MQIPESFKTKIKAVFYDKTITRYSTVAEADSRGWTKKAGTTVTNGTFLGNLQFDNFEKIQELYGISESIDIAITTDAVVELEEILGYEGKQYKVFRKIEHDSHYLLLARKWLSKSSISISS